MANVRWAFVLFLPNVKAILSGEDKTTNDRLTAIIEKLGNDPDAEVRHQLGIVQPLIQSADKDKVIIDYEKKKIIFKKVTSVVSSESLIYNTFIELLTFLY